MDWEKRLAIRFIEYDCENWLPAILRETSDVNYQLVYLVLSFEKTDGADNRSKGRKTIQLSEVGTANNGF